MQPKPRIIERFHVLGGVEQRQNLFDLADMLGVQPFGVVILEKLPQSLVAKTLDHRCPVIAASDV